MAEVVRVGIVGGGWPGAAHARGYRAAGGFKIVAVADAIPDRRKRLMAEFGATTEYADAMELVADKEIDLISVCLPNHLHAPVAIAALKGGKHVVCEIPPTISAKEARQIEAAATKSGKTVLYALQRRFGGHEQAAKQAIGKGYAGEVYHARASWMRTRGIPVGTGWFTDKAKAGGGAMADLGLHMLDLAWHLLGQPKPLTLFATADKRFRELAAPEAPFNVEDAAFALIRLEGGKSIELACSWAFNQPPSQNGAICRLSGDKGAVDVYTPQGAMLYRSFTATGEAKATPLKGPKMVQHAAMMRHLRECLAGKATPIAGAKEGVALMQMLEAIYKSAETGKSVEIKA